VWLLLQSQQQQQQQQGERYTNRLLRSFLGSPTCLEAIQQVHNASTEELAGESPYKCYDYLWIIRSAARECGRMCGVK
jgi:IS30 family transposase